uniref:Uncharacterized protein n=1 Tax=Strongyloides papillosus TaxID=174720 RepID=A0A0N5B7E2_STREA
MVHHNNIVPTYLSSSSSLSPTQSNTNIPKNPTQHNLDEKKGIGEGMITSFRGSQEPQSTSDFVTHNIASNFTTNLSNTFGVSLLLKPFRKTQKEGNAKKSIKWSGSVDVPTEPNLSFIDNLLDQAINEVEISRHVNISLPAQLIVSI